MLTNCKASNVGKIGWKDVFAIMEFKFTDLLLWTGSLGILATESEYSNLHNFIQNLNFK
jgi:hypothetical protein